jgi:dTDP-4-amino-4,6-dideoxygalactose transaminase
MLEAAGIGTGDVVLTSPFSFISSANAVKHADGEPAFADIRPDTYNLDPDAVRAVLEDRSDVAALLPVHLYGLPAAMDEFRMIADEYDLLLFEDAAQAHGATFEGAPVGSLGDAAAFSFYPTKNMTTGEGGMVTTDDDELAERIRRLIDHGRTGSYEHATVGYNFRMTNIQAAIGREQLRQLPDWVSQRQTNAARLSERLGPIEQVSTPRVPPDREHAFHQYTIRTEQRDRFRAALDSQDVGYGIYYPTPIPHQPAYGSSESFPVAERASDEVVSLPVHPHLTSSDIETIVSVVSESLGE